MQKIRKQSLPTIFVYLLLLVSCKQQPSSHLELDVVDSLCNVNPQAAMEMLDNYKHVKSKMPKSVQMRYDLLQTKAQDKAVISHTSDSVMKRVVAYYEEHGTVNERLESMYYMGSVYRDLHDSPRALTWYLKATAWGEKHIHEVDSAILSRVYAQLSWIYHTQYNYKEALEANKREYNLSADSITDLQTTMDLAGNYMILEKADTGFMLYDIVLKRIQELNAEANNIPILAAMLGQYSEHYHDYDKAKPIKDIIMRYPEAKQISNVLPALAYYYDAFGPADSAIYFYRRLLQHKELAIRTAAAMNLTLNFHYLHQKDSVDKYAIQYIILNDSVISDNNIVYF